MNAIILTPSEFDRLASQIREQISNEIQKIEVVEKPITFKQACEFMQLGHTAMYKKIAQGMPAHKDGKQYYFYPSELNKYIKSKKA